MIWLALAGCRSDQVGEADDRNVLVVLIDDMGVDKWARHGVWPGQPDLSTLDRLADEGTRFETAWAAPVCSASRAALLTGRHGRRTGVGSNVERDDELSLDAALLPERLVDHASHAIGKWHLATERSPSGLDHPVLQGFDTFSGTLDNLDDYRRWDEVEDGELHPVRRHATVEAIDDAIARIAEAPAPWFVYVALHAAHDPFEAPPGSGLSDDDDPSVLVAAMLEHADAELGRLLDALHPEVLDEATVIVLGDNGTPGAAVTAPFDPDEAKVTVYDGGVHVPLVIRSPHVARPGASSSALVEIVDVTATVLDVAGVEPADDLDGRSLLPQLADPDAPGRDVLGTERFLPIGPPPYYRDHRSVRDGSWQLVVKRNHDVERTELYELDGPTMGPDRLALADPDPEALEALERLAPALEARDALPFEGR